MRIISTLRIPLLITVIAIFVAGCGDNKKSGNEKGNESTESSEVDEVSNDSAPQEIVVEEITEKEVTYSAGDVTMKGFCARPKGIDAKFPGIIVIHEWWGHNEHARNSARKLAKLGYVAFAIDMFGEGKNADHPMEAMKMTKSVNSDMEENFERFEAALSWLKSNEHVNSDKIGALGYCFGGSVAINNANKGIGIDAVVGLHTGIGGVSQAPAKGLETQFLVVNGSDDPFITNEQKTNFKKMMSDVKLDYIELSGAKHAFTNPNADTMAEKFSEQLGGALAYSEAADRDSWELLTNFFEMHLKSFDKSDTEG